MNQKAKEALCRHDYIFYKRTIFAEYVICKHCGKVTKNY